MKVVVRCRPLTPKEKAAGYNEVVEMSDGRVSVTMNNGTSKEFSFDDVYDWNSRQKDLYDKTFKGLVDSVMKGFNGTIFAYGQTGTGKTFTMQGVRNDAELQGVIPNSFGHIFNYIAESSNEQYLVRASFLEIYMEEIRDLLSRDQGKRLECKERPDCGVYVKDLSSFVTKNEKEIQQIMDVGNKNRSVGSTYMNEQSSRSHAIFIITVECSSDDSSDEKKYKVGKLNLVDLAGSERQSKSGAEGDRLKEANKINLSLSTLGMVISALVERNKSHIPYRDSKLTRLLQDSLGGNAKTIMVANIGPASYNLDESLTTLRYASNAKKIKNTPKINEDPKDALLRRFQDEIKALQMALQTSNRTSTTNTEDAFVSSEQENFQEERDNILNNKMLIEEEKKRLLSHLSAKEELLQKERETQEDLSQQIAKMESKLLTGGANIVDHTNEQQKALEVKRQQIAEEQVREQEMKRKLLEQEETALNLTETYNSYQQEADAKTKKLKKLFMKLQSSKVEIKELIESNANERHELESTLNDLIRELKLKTLIVDNFIPPSEKTQMMEGVEYDEVEDGWVVKKNNLQRNNSIKLSPSINHLHRPYDENILQVDLELPIRTTRDYEDPVIAPKIQGLLNAVLAEDKEIEVSHLK